ncbi:MAG TPA: alternative ribosome rescue aminoacyl-tRNA hydrolase ArfB [Caulobacteraceae bacterium]|jgi:ribosome-associated protein|nr:alternative ribosome rescue aminoacyl-tRNA hydrolase ArfB [Caulobacteraceae bacterium]
MIRITDTIAVHEDELSFSFIRASGPGGQNVNKVSSAAQLRFDARRSPSLSPEIITRLERLAGARLTQDGVIVITARRFASQERNRADAEDRLVSLIAKAAVVHPKRRRTRPSRAVKEQRLADKSRRSSVKNLRGRPSDDG